MKESSLPHCRVNVCMRRGRACSQRREKETGEVELFLDRSIYGSIHHLSASTIFFLLPFHPFSSYLWVGGEPFSPSFFLSFSSFFLFASFFSPVAFSRGVEVTRKEGRNAKRERKNNRRFSFPMVVGRCELNRLSSLHAAKSKFFFSPSSFSLFFLQTTRRFFPCSFSHSFLSSPRSLLFIFCLSSTFERLPSPSTLHAPLPQ